MLPWSPGPDAGAAAGPPSDGAPRPGRDAQPGPAPGPGASPAADEADEAAAVVLGPTGRPLPDLPEPQPVSVHGPARVLALCNQKGGVGKTTTTINLGAALAGYGRRVLLVDFDPQGALSVGLGVPVLDLELTVVDLLLRRGLRWQDAVVPTRVEGVDLLPADIYLSGAEVRLVSEIGREQVLARALAPLRDHYDYVLIDCQPSLGLLTINALTAADAVLIPVECEYFALRGTALLMETIETVQERSNPRLQVEGVLATMFDSRTLHAREALARLVDAFGDRVFHTVVNRTVKFPEASSVGQSIVSYAQGSPGARAYQQLAREVIRRREEALAAAEGR